MRSKVRHLLNSQMKTTNISFLYDEIFHPRLKVYNVDSSILVVNCGVAGSLIKKQIVVSIQLVINY
jgi:hypothetical protein